MMPKPVKPGVWAEIALDTVVITGAVSRRVVPQLKHDVHVGETRPDRHRFLDMELLGSAGNLPPTWRHSKGLEIRTDASVAGTTRILLLSTTPLGDPVFSELVNDVVSTLVQHPGEEAASQVVERVISWQEFFARKGESFTKEQAAGLFAELAVLSTGFVPSIGSAAAVTAWTGPDPAIQDFQYGVCALEVKSFRGTGPGQMMISSERQLDGVGTAALFLAYVELDERHDGTGQSLLEKVSEVRVDISDSAHASHLFAGKLRSLGWDDSYDELRHERYEIRSVEYFDVIEGFPRLVQTDLPTGVGAVSYVLARSALDPFLLGAAEAFERIKDEH